MRIKEIILKSSAVFFMAAYLLSLAGFDIHTCSHSGKTYVNFLAVSLSCEDIHPSDEAARPCACGHCHDQHHSNSKGGCCSDETYQLLLGSDDSGFDVKHIAAPVNDLPAVSALESYVSEGFKAEKQEWRPYLASHAPDILHSFCILRI